MSELWCHTHYRLTGPVMTLTYDCWPGKRFPQWHLHVEYLWHIWLQFLHYVQRYCIMQNRWLRTARLMPLEHNASSTYYWRMNKNWAQSLVTDSLLVQMLRKNSGTAAWTAFNTIKFYHPFNQLLPVIITLPRKEVMCYPAFARLCVCPLATSRLLIKSSPKFHQRYIVWTRKNFKLWTSSTSVSQSRNFLKDSLTCKIGHFSTIYLSSLKKNNWIFTKCYRRCISGQGNRCWIFDIIWIRSLDSDSDPDWIHLGGGVTCSYLTHVVLLQWYQRCQGTGNISQGDTALDYTFTYCQDLLSVWCAFCTVSISSMHMDCF